MLIDLWEYEMSHMPRKLPPTTVKLNATELSQHIKMLMDQEKVSPDTDLLLLALVFWATENLPLDRNWAEKVVDAAAVAVTRNPEAGYKRLAGAEPGILGAETLEEAGMALMRLMADIVSPD